MNKIRITENYASDEKLINEFHNFISKVFPSISFKEWHRKGFWTEKYIPYSIIDSGKIFSSACVAEMTIILNGRKKKGIQIGAVGTLPEYRNKGLSRILMNHILEKYENDIDLFFLFANETVMEFYPKFGFRHIDERIFISDNQIPGPEYKARKLDVINEADYKILTGLINNRLPLTNIFGADDYGFITMWHVLNLYADDLYYLEEEKIVFIKKERENTLKIIDVIFKEPFDFQSVLPKVITSNSVELIKYYFPPDVLRYNYSRTAIDDSGLFVRGEFISGDNLIKFPETGHT